MGQYDPGAATRRSLDVETEYVGHAMGLSKVGRANRSWAWRAFLALGLVMALAYVLLPDRPPFPHAGLLIIGVLSALAVLGGLLLNRPRHAWSWVLLLASLLLITTGDAIWSYYELVLEIESPFPAPPDAIYIGGYFAMIASLMLFIRRRSPSRDTGSLIDATIIATGVGVVSWIYLMEPYANDASMPIFSRLVSIAYPLLDVLALALVARLLLAPGKRPTAFYLLSIGLLIQLVTDTAFVALVLSGKYFTGHPIDVGWFGFYVLAALAALHPSMRELSDPDPERQANLTRWRIGLLAAASLLAPGMLAVLYATNDDIGRSVNVPVIAGASVLLFLLVLARVLGLVRKHERAVTREKTLRGSGAALVGALDREGIYSAALDAALDLTHAAPEVRVGLALGPQEGMVVAASGGFRASEIEGQPFKADALPAPLRQRFLDDHSIEMREGKDTDAALKRLGPFQERRSFFAVPLFVQGGLRGMIGATSGLPLSEEAKDGLESLGAQVALALESASLRENLHERRSEERFRSLVRNASDILMVLRPDRTVGYLSPAVEKVLGYEPEKLTDTDSLVPVHPDDEAQVRDVIARAIDEPGSVLRAEIRLRHADGSWRHVESQFTSLLDDPTVRGIVVNSRDITDRKEAEQRLAEAEARYRTLVERMPAVTYVQGLAEPGRPAPTVYVSPQVEAQTGYPPEAFVEDPELWIKLVHPDDYERILAEELRTEETGELFDVEYRLVRRDGSVVWIRDEAVLVRDEEGEPLFWQGVELDITERKEAEEQLSYQAFHDALTGLPNRALLMDRLGFALARTRRGERAAALLFLDLDRFKVVNDSLGHEVGDKLLVEVGGRLRNCLRPEDTVARIGGDEFAILLEDVPDADHAVQAAGRITATMNAPFLVEGKEMVVTTSIGIVLGSSPASDPSDLLRDADIAMYRAKEKGKARYELFDPSMNAQAMRRLELENQLRRALEREELRVHYQPKVDLTSGAVVGTEALVRWEHPERGLVSPAEFIPLAEETGLILPLGRWVLEEACRQAKEWQESRPGASETISINLSAKQFQQKGLVEEISKVLRDTRLQPSCLVLEITESVLMEGAEANGSTLLKLKELGVRVALDDFGTGYSSLSYLRRFPVDVLKIDRSFIRGLGEEPGSGAIAQAVIDLGEALGLQLVAEGIETAGQAERLREMGCRIGQGFYFSRPLRVAEATDLLLHSPTLAPVPGAP